MIPDSLAGVLRLGKDELKQFDRQRRSGPFSEPRWVMMRSLLFPGWGQAYNRSWFKALVIGGTEFLLIAGILDDQRALDDLQNDVDAVRDSGGNPFDEEEAYNARLDQQIRRKWWLGGVVAYSMMDAYVDAHFRTFRMRLGPDFRSGAPRAALRAGWEWTF